MMCHAHRLADSAETPKEKTLLAFLVWRGNALKNGMERQGEGRFVILLVCQQKMVK